MSFPKTRNAHMASLHKNNCKEGTQRRTQESKGVFSRTYQPKGPSPSRFFGFGDAPFPFQKPWSIMLLILRNERIFPFGTTPFYTISALSVRTRIRRKTDRAGTDMDSTDTSMDTGTDSNRADRSYKGAG